MSTGLAASGSAFLLGQLLADDLPVLLVLLILLGLGATAAALCLRFRAGIEASPSRLSPRALAALTAVTALLALASTALLLLKLFWSEGPPWRTGTVLFFWVLTGPWCAALAFSLSRQRQGWGPAAPRLEGAALLVLAALVAFLTCWSLYWGPERAEEWDSLRTFFAGAALAGFAASPLVAAPRRLRRALVSALLVLHFGGIVSAFLSEAPGPWVARQVRQRFYAPYLEFMYLINAYRFYAPDPGPADQVWFRVEYQDGDRILSHWRKLPDISDDGEPNYPLRLQYQRRLALTIQAGLTLLPRGPTGDEQRLRAAQTARKPPRFFGDLGAEHLILKEPVPLLNNPAIREFRFPQPITQQLYASYARHVLRQPHPTVAHARPLRVKIYVVQHRILDPTELALHGADPRDPILFCPYYEGEYDVNGELTVGCLQDPFLHWLLPMVRDPQNPDAVIAYVFVHAGDPHRRTVPGRAGERLPQLP
jgi:hypothetical protein